MLFVQTYSFASFFLTILSCVSDFPSEVFVLLSELCPFNYDPLFIVCVVYQKMYCSWQLLCWAYSIRLTGHWRCYSTGFCFQLRKVSLLTMKSQPSVYLTYLYLMMSLFSLDTFTFSLSLMFTFTRVLIVV